MNVRDLAEGLARAEGVIIGWGRTEFDSFGEALVGWIDPGEPGFG